MAGIIDIDTKDLMLLVNKLASIPKGAPIALSAAINRTSSSMKTHMAREVTSEYDITQKKVKGTIKVLKATPNRLEGGVTSTGYTIPLTAFKFKASSLIKQRKTVISVKIKKKGGFKTIATTPSEFIQTIKGKLSIAQREGKKRYPIKTLTTLAIPQMIDNPTVIKNIEDKAQKTLQERINHEIEYRLEKARKEGNI